MDRPVSRVFRPYARWIVAHRLVVVAAILVVTGFFVSRLAVGRWLQAGDVIGKVYDGFDGEQRHEVRAPIAGLLSGLRRQALLFEGDLIARIQSRQSVGEGVDTYLHGQGQ